MTTSTRWDRLQDRLLDVALTVAEETVYLIARAAGIIAGVWEFHVLRRKPCEQCGAGLTPGHACDPEADALWRR
jgi:hypothetical protein